MLMMVAPVTAGTVATHAILSFLQGLYQGGLRWAIFLDSKETLQDAVAAGAVGILVPREFAPVLAGRWKLVGDERHSLMLSSKRSHPKGASREPHIPSPEAKLEFILPPQSKLPGYKDFKFYPSSSSAAMAIAVIQLVYGVYQLVTQYGSEISLMGLSSPYIFVVPYLLMSLVNLFANTVMPSYTHVVILSPEGDFSTTDSTELSRRNSTSTITSKPESEKTAITAPTQNKTDENVDVEATGEDIGITSLRRELYQFKPWGGRLRHHVQEIEFDKFYMSLTDIAGLGPKPSSDGLALRERKKICRQHNPQISFITWTIRWSWLLRTNENPLRRSSSWSRECQHPTELEEGLRGWLTAHYPGVDADITARPLRLYQLSRYISVFSTLILSTVIIGVITRFRFMVGLYAGRFISFIYIPPTLLLVPFFALGVGGSSVNFWKSVEGFSRFVNNLMISAYIGALVTLIQCLWDIGNCTVWSQADNQTWLSST